MMAFAPSKRRSRWRSRKAGWPARTRRPSHTPSPRTKPASNTDTTARSRGTRAPSTQTRMRSLRASSSKSWVPWAMARNPMGPGAAGASGAARVGQQLGEPPIGERLVVERRHLDVAGRSVERDRLWQHIAGLETRSARSVLAGEPLEVGEEAATEPHAPRRFGDPHALDVRHPARVVLHRAAPDGLAPQVEDDECPVRRTDLVRLG